MIDDWRDIALPKELSKGPRARTLGANSLVTGFGSEFEALGSINNAFPRSGVGSACSATDSLLQKNAAGVRSSEWWFDEDGLFNLDDEGRAEKQQCAVGTSNIVRNFSFMPENEVIVAQHRHCLETMFQCIEDHVTEYEELVTNALETIAERNERLKPSWGFWDHLSKPGIVRLLNHLGIHKRLADLMSLAFDAQAAAVGALYNLAEVNVDCRLKLASERWAIDRLLKVIKTLHPVPEVCRKAAMILESLVSEPQNRVLLLAYENAFAEMLFSDGRYSDTFARILYELTSIDQTTK
ncbi:armadillo repeat-containing protein LFR [Citrus sinensis]|nr:armadillo repeat-containing protein LFR [Citrus sinensis]